VTEIIIKRKTGGRRQKKGMKKNLGEMVEKEPEDKQMLFLTKKPSVKKVEEDFVVV